MSASLVGSEMCIRDRADPLHGGWPGPPQSLPQTGTVFWARALEQSDLGCRRVALNAAMCRHRRWQCGAP
eukprot:2801667-Alexandrium_andersonii.AAC.1